MAGATPAEQGMDATVLEGARTYAFQPGKNTQGVVVTRRGVLVAEWYEEGRDATSYAGSWSMAKSFTSALVGIAIDEGKIPGVDVKLVDYYPQWAGSPRADITLENVLHMSTGPRCGSRTTSIEQRERLGRRPARVHDRQSARLRLGKPLELPPGHDVRVLERRHAAALRRDREGDRQARRRLRAGEAVRQGSASRAPSGGARRPARR